MFPVANGTRREMERLMMTLADLAAEVGATAQTEPQMDEVTLPFLGRDRTDLQYPFGDLQRSGAAVGDAQ